MSSEGKKYKHKDIKAFDETLKHYENFKIPAKYSKDDSWEKFKTVIETPHEKAPPKTRSLKVFYTSAAAIILLLIGLSLFNYFNANIIITSKNGENKLVVLPDSSTVELNAASTLSYNQFGWKHHRLVILDGEGFFSVKKGKRFEVKTNHGNVVVLGTSFNVFARNENFFVVCKTGKVKVESINTVVLTPGLKAFKNKDQKINIENAIVEHETAWQNGEFWFNNVRLIDVLNELERQFDIKIVYKDIENRRYTGYFNIKSLQDALTAVCSPMQLKFKNENDKTYIIY